MAVMKGSADLHGERRDPAILLVCTSGNWGLFWQKVIRWSCRLSWQRPGRKIEGKKKDGASKRREKGGQTVFWYCVCALLFEKCLWRSVYTGVYLPICVCAGYLTSIVEKVKQQRGFDWHSNLLQHCGAPYIIKCWQKRTFCSIL